MERREAVKYISVLLGGAVIGADAFLTGCKTKTASTTDWTAEDVAYLNEIGETILPRTATPGAKDANVGQFMTTMVNDCYEAADQKAFKEGLNKLNDASKKKFDADFMKITPQQRTQLLTEIDAEAKAYQANLQKEKEKAKADMGEGSSRGNVEEKKAAHYFTMMKQLTLLGFFTSETGVKKALRWQPTPGKYEGCVPYKKGDRMIA